MQLRSTISNVVGLNHYVAQIYWDKDWQEYQVRLSINGQTLKAATYHTEWMTDALSTANAMCKLPPVIAQP